MSECLKIVLRDLNPMMAEAWTPYFSGCLGVEVGCGEIFDVCADAIVSPANSFGFMDGGIDAVYLKRFGSGLQHRLQSKLQAQFYGELPVGQAVLVETGDPDIPWLVSAPTMRVPMPVAHTMNAYLAFRATLIAIGEHNRTSGKSIRKLLCPGLATAIGRMPAPRCAQQMRLAYDVVEGGRTWPLLSPKEIWQTHGELTGRR